MLGDLDWSYIPESEVDNPVPGVFVHAFVAPYGDGMLVFEVSSLPTTLALCNESGVTIVEAPLWERTALLHCIYRKQRPCLYPFPE